MRLVAGLVAALLLASPARAWADDDPMEAARVHYEAGEQHYLRGRYPQAIEEFLEAYRLSKRPELLFNISQAYERNGDWVNARDYLRKYLDSGVATPEERPLLEDKVREFDRKIADDEERARKRKEEEDRLRAAANRPRARPFKTWKWVAAGSGVALGAASALFAWDSARMATKVEDGADKEPPNDFGDFADYQARGERDEVLAYVTGAVGVVALGIGVVFFVLDRPAEVTPVAEPGGGAGAQVLVRW